MIASVEGVVAAVAVDSLVIEVGGIGYRVQAAPAVLAAASPGGRLKLHTFHLVREDQQALFGFRTIEELGFFNLLLTVTGVGPKVALAIVGSRPTPDLQLAIMQQDQAVLVSIPGIGRKLAERVIFELKEKVAAAGVAAASTTTAGPAGEGEIVAALQALGYSLAEARDASRAIHVDIDPAEIGKNVAVEVPIVGDARRVIERLTPLVEEVDPATRAEYFAELAEWRRESEGSSWHGSGAWRDGLLSADYVVSRIGELTAHEGVYIADVGQNQMWLARYTGFRHPNTHVSSGGLGTMGFSVPAAMGAALGTDRETWAIAGDGGFQMTLQELMTLVQDRIPVKIALFDNKKLGMIRQWQEIIYAGNYHSAHLLGPDYLKLAEAFGIPATKASTPAEVDDAIRFAQGVDGPALVWFEIAEEQNVFPMMPAGKGLSDLIEKWEGADE